MERGPRRFSCHVHFLHINSGVDYPNVFTSESLNGVLRSVHFTFSTFTSLKKSYWNEIIEVYRKIQYIIMYMARWWFDFKAKLRYLLHRFFNRKPVLLVLGRWVELQLLKGRRRWCIKEWWRRAEWLYNSGNRSSTSDEEYRLALYQNEISRQEILALYPQIRQTMKILP